MTLSLQVDNLVSCYLVAVGHTLFLWHSLIEQLIREYVASLVLLLYVSRSPSLATQCLTK